MEAEWPSAEFHCSTYWSGRWGLACRVVYDWAKASSKCCCNVSSGVCHQSQDPRSYRNASRKAEVAVRGKPLIYSYPSLSFNPALVLTKIFSSLSGHFHQGFQLSGLLQHEQWCSHSLGAEGERREKEMIPSTTKKSLPRNVVARSTSLDRRDITALYPAFLSYEQRCLAKIHIAVLGSYAI